MTSSPSTTLARHVLRAGALATVLLLGTAPAALAADDGPSIAHVESSRTGLQVLVNVPADATVDLSGVAVTVDDRVAESEARLAATTTDVRRTAVLAIDTSNSMRGLRFAAAQSAALAFLDAVPDDVEVGVVSFAGEVSPLLEPTTDRDRAREVVGALSLSRQTKLYDGVLAAADMAGTEGQRTLVVLSDGADTTDTPLADVTDAITGAELIVDVVSLDQTGSAVAPLRAMAKAGSGRVVTADSGALRRAFAREADVLARQVLVTAQVPAGVTATEATVAVTLPTDTGDLEARAFTTIGSDRAPAATAAAGPAAEPGWAPPAWMMYAGTGALGVGLVAVLLLLVPAKPAPLSAETVVTTYTDTVGGRTPAPRADTEQALAQATHAATEVLQRNKSLDARISQRLQSAGSDLKAAEWLLLHTAIVVGAGVLGLLLGTGSLMIGLLFLALGLVGPWIYLGVRGSRRRKAFDTSLPDTLQLMSGSLAAGLSLAQSVDTIVREGVEPVASEFKRVLIETRLGVPLEDALEGVGERFESKDFAWVVMAIKIQRQVGGNLAELLENVAGTMREREYMRRQVAALAAEGKLSAWVLGGLPPAFLLYLVVANGDYVHPLFVTPIGIAMLIGAGLLLSVGVFWMSRMIKVEV
nr:type II secretion system F family protein [Nocardioides luti]